ncbi:MAG: TetR family transcriptional regulator, partial [Amaricoccus sp.]
MSDASPPRAYHHGNLREALLAGAERILERDGADALTLRAAARAVGVTHAAPRNHFGDLTGLLSELAALAASAAHDDLD